MIPEFLLPYIAFLLGSITVAAYTSYVIELLKPQKPRRIPELK